MPQPIRINNFKQGIAETPAVGFGTIRGEIKRDGFLRANRSVSNMENGLTNRLKYFTQDPISGAVFGIDGDGGVWQKATDTWNAIANVETSIADGNGIGIYKDYIIKCRRNKIDVAAVSNPSIWTDDWASINAAGYGQIEHPQLWGQRDKFYIGDGRYVHYIDAGSTFDPGSDTLTTNALDLPEDYKIKGLAELGKYLLVLAERPNANEVAVFPWDQVSSSFNLPIIIKEPTAHAIQVQLNQVYVLAGTSLYTSNLSTASKVFDFDFLQNDTDFLEKPSFGTQPFIFNSDELLFGLGNNTYTSISPVGVYALEDGGLSLKAGISTGSDGSGGGDVTVTSVFVTNDGDILFGWADNQTWGIDKISEERDRDYNSYLISPLYTVSRSANPTSYQSIEVYLNQKLASGDGFRISYRESLEDDWVLVTDTVATDGDYDFAAIGNVANHRISATIPNTPTIQFKIEMKRDINIKEVIIS